MGEAQDDRPRDEGLFTKVWMDKQLLEKKTKYPWGDTDFHPLINPWGFMCLGILEITTAAYLTGTSAAASADAWPKPKVLYPVALVSIVYMVIYISHIGNHWQYMMAAPKGYTTVENYD